jgi:hypothetical protein
MQFIVDIPENAETICVLDHAKWKLAMEHIKNEYPEVYADLQNNFQFNVHIYDVIEYLESLHEC